ncbi:MAG: hypothetical protein ACHQYQ_11915, partial [Bacteriovoracales bacterium]
MKRILFFLMLIGLSSYAFADDFSSTLALDEDCPLTDPNCPLPTGDVPPGDVATGTTGVMTHAIVDSEPAEKAWWTLCISVNSGNRKYGIGFDRNFVRATYEAYNRCRYTSGPWAQLCGRPQCFSVNVPNPFPFPGGGGGGPGGGGPWTGGPG